MYHLLSECCGAEPDDRFHYSYTWNLGTCSSCQEKTEFNEEDGDEKND